MLLREAGAAGLRLLAASGDGSSSEAGVIGTNAPQASSPANNGDQDDPLLWIRVWVDVQWVVLCLACAAAFYLVVQSVTLHRTKNRLADVLLCIIGLSDLSFSVLETLKQHMHWTYLGMYAQEARSRQNNGFSGHPGDGMHTGMPPMMPSSLEVALHMLSRFSFFMSLYWVASLSLLMRLGKVENLHVQRSFVISVVLGAVYGCMHANLRVIHNNFAYTMNAALLLLVQVVILAAITSNLQFVSRSRIRDSPQGRNVVRRLTGYCICAAFFTLPFALLLLLSEKRVAMGAITETLNYFLPMANTVLFTTGLTCCFGAKTDLQDKANNPNANGNPYHDSLVGPTTEMLIEGPVVKIGEGTSAIVYKTQWLGITVAMKCIRLQGISEGSEELYMTHMSEMQAEFWEEAALAAQLRHPNITLFIKMGTYKDSVCLVNEYCARGSLRDVLKANPLLEWTTKVRLAFEAAKGLAFMHNREPIYLHRDIKASNILITEDWTAKISDFGISRIATDFTVKKRSTLLSVSNNQSVTDVTTFAGTWRWNAPEVMHNPNEVRFNRATDVYSFGVALWEILANGAIPFGDVEFDHQVRALVESGERPKFNPVYVRRAPSEFVELIKACWDQHPQNRPSAQEVMLRLGSLSYTLYNEASPSMRTSGRHVFSDNYYEAMGSSRSCYDL